MLQCCVFCVFTSSQMYDLDRARPRQVFSQRNESEKKLCKLVFLKTLPCLCKIEIAIVIFFSWQRLDFFWQTMWKFWYFTSRKITRKMSSPPKRPRLPRCVTVNGVQYFLNKRPLIQSKCWDNFLILKFCMWVKTFYNCHQTLAKIFGVNLVWCKTLIWNP